MMCLFNPSMTSLRKIFSSGFAYKVLSINVSYNVVLIIIKYAPSHYVQGQAWIPACITDFREQNMIKIKVTFPKFATSVK